MKVFFIAILLVSFLQSDEMKRIESIVDDIAKLRVDYERCQDSLKSKKPIKADIVEYKKDEVEVTKYKELLKTQRQKNIILKAELDFMSESSSNSNKAIKNYKNILKTKEDKIQSLKNKLDSFNKKSSKILKPAQVCREKEDDNSFPKLMPKENPKVKVEVKKEVETFKASSFRLNVTSAIYDKPDGKKVDIWEKTRSFTSNKKTISWTKITGYFIDKKWVKAKKEMWIKSTEISKR